MIDDASLPDEHRRFVRYWNTRRGTKPLPARRDVDPLVDLPELASHLGIMRPIGDRIFYAVLGGGIEEASGPRTGTYLDETRVPPFRDYLEAMFRLCAARATLVLTRHGFTYDGGKIGRTVRVVAPLADDGAAIDGYLGLQISYDDQRNKLPHAWEREPIFPADLLTDLAWRDGDGAWHAVDWRAQT